MKNPLACLLALCFICSPGLSSSAMAQNPKSGASEYKVIINHEEQYAVWPADKPLPLAWKDTWKSGSQAQCQEYIEAVWIDMRPVSIRKMNLPRDAEYRVIINHEEQYLIWPAALALPQGWLPTIAKGSFSKCTEHIRMVWTDKRPLSLRESKRTVGN